MSRSSETRVIRFGSFEANLDAWELRKHGLKVKLPNHSFVVLACLLEKPGVLVTREEIRARIWPETTHVDFDNSLNTMIRHVREVLGDSARNPRFIDTVRGRGYRFVAPVEVDAGAELTKPERRRWSPWSYVVSAAAAAVVLLAWFPNANPRASEGSWAPKLSPLTSFVGAEGHPSFSPDGERVAFHWNGPERGGFDIYVKDVNGVEALRITDHPADDLSPVWAPRGARIAFLREFENSRAAIMVVPEQGGPEQQVAVIPSTASNLAWSPDGEWIAYSVSIPEYVHRPPGQSGILAVSVKSGRTIRITDPDPLFVGDAYPAVSPDGSKLAFVRIPSIDAGELYVVDIDAGLRAAGEPRRLTFDNADARNPAWTANGRDIVFVSRRSGQSSLWKIRASGDSDPVALGGENASTPAVAPAGSRIAYRRLTSANDLWKIDLDQGPPISPQRLTYTTTLERNASFSPDGRAIAFESNRSGSHEIWVANSDGSSPVQLSFFEVPVTGTPHWSPDAEYLVFDSRVRGQGEIFAIAAAGGAPRRLTTSVADDVVPSVSRDGKWIYFASNRTGSFQVWKIPVNGGVASQVTHQGGFHAKESLDGTVLYYTKGTEHTVVCRAPVDGGEEVVLFGPVNYWENFALGRDQIYFMTASGPRQSTIRSYDLNNGEIRDVATIDDSSPGGLSLSPDGKTLMFAMREDLQSDLILMTME